MGGGSAPAGASGIPSNTLPAAMAYQPTAQPQSDIQLQNIFSGLQPTTQQYTGNDPIFTGLIFPDTPGGNAYPYGAGNYIGRGTITDPGNAYLQQAIQTAQGLISPFAGLVSQLQGYTGPGSQSTQGALDYSAFINQLFPQAQGVGQGILDSAQQVGGLANQLVPGAQSIIANQQAPQIGQQIMYGVGGALPNAIAQANQAAGNLYGYGNQILNTAFDPQSALFNQLQNQVSQQAQAANAAAGLGSSAYGASQVGNTLSNFDINWQNQQLARQAQGLSSAGPAFSTAGGLLPTALTGLGQAAGVGEQLTAAPYQLGGAISNIIAQLATSGANLSNLGLGTLYNAGQQRFNASQAPLQAAGAQATAMGQADQLLSQLASQPYNMQSIGAQNALQALANVTNIGNQQFVVPQQLANDLQSYLGLGQAASQLSGQLGALGQQESLQSMMGLGSALGAGSNLLFGNQGLSGALGLGNTGLLGGLGGLFGGGTGAASAPLLTAATPGAFATLPFTDLAAGGTAAAAGGGGLASFAPLAALGS